MKAFRFLSRPFALRAFIFLALVTPIVWVHANAPITDKITGRKDMHHYFRGKDGNTFIAINRGYYVILNLVYAGETIGAKNWKIDQAPRRSSFGGFTTSPLPWYQTMTANVEVYREGTNEKVGTYSWSGKLTQEPGVGFTYRCNVPGDRTWAVDMGLNFCYEKGTSPDASAVNVSVR